MKTTIVFLAVLLAPLTAHAQHVNAGRLEEGTDVVTLTTGLEHGLVLGLGYAHVVSVAGRPVVVGGDLSLGWAELDVEDFRLRAGALAPVVGRGRWKVLAGATAIVRGTENDLGRMTSVGADLAILGGYHARRGLVAAELGFDWAMATHVAHGDAYRMHVYPDARDGWYRSTGGTLRAGLQGGLSFGRVDVILRAGRLAESTGEAPMLPFYGTLTLDTRW